MNVLRIAYCVLLALASAVVLGGCARPEKPANTRHPSPVTRHPSPVTCSLTDALGREVRLERPAQRLVSLWPSATEMVCALGLEERLVGVTSWCNYPPSVKKKTIIGDPNTPQIEKLVELVPDLVLAPFGTPQEVVQQMDRLGLPVFGLDPKTIEEVFTAMRQIGQLTGTEEKSERIVKALEERAAAVDSRLRISESGFRSPESGKSAIRNPQSTIRRPRVYLEMYASGSEISTFGPDNFANDLLERAGGRNVFADAETPYPQISAEQVLERNPEFIIIAHHQAATEEVSARPGWSSLAAVQQNRIYRYPDPDEFLRPGPRLVNVLEWLARTLHPELFRPAQGNPEAGADSW